MDIKSKTELTRGSLSLSETKVADYIVNNIDAASRMNIVSIANETGVSLPTVTRLAKKLGYEGFADFRFSLISEVSEKQAFGEERMEKDEENFDADSHFGRTIRSLIQTSHSFSVSDVAEVASKIRKARRVFVVASDTSAPPGQRLSYILSKMGIDATFIGEINVLPSAIAHSSQEDVYIIISCSSHSKTTVEALKVAKESKAYVAFLCNYINTLSYSCADKTLYAARVEGLNRATAFCADIAMPTLLNMLLELVAESNAID